MHLQEISRLEDAAEVFKESDSLRQTLEDIREDYNYIAMRKYYRGRFEPFFNFFIAIIISMFLTRLLDIIFLFSTSFASTLQVLFPFAAIALSYVWVKNFVSKSMEEARAGEGHNKLLEFYSDILNRGLDTYINFAYEHEKTNPLGMIELLSVGYKSGKSKIDHKHYFDEEEEMVLLVLQYQGTEKTIEMHYEKHLNQIDFLPRAYWFGQYVPYLIERFQTKRADNLNEALDQLDVEIHRMRQNYDYQMTIEEIQQREKRLQDELRRKERDIQFLEAYMFSNFY